MESKRCKGFTMVEVMVTVLILGVMAAVLTINPKAAEHSAKREAEKVAVYIEKLMKKSDRMHTSFDIEVEDKLIKVSWGIHGSHRESFDVSKGCSYTPSAEIMTYDRNHFNNKAKITVDNDEKDSSNKEYDYHIKVTDSSNSTYYVGITKNQ
ncbi:MAG: type II secretion system protein [Synergistaceae bacterium]|nr:type II secretion system protein [Synergistaceae bacterium]